jgi:hypothetical protein
LLQTLFLPITFYLFPLSIHTCHHFNSCVHHQALYHHEIYCHNSSHKVCYSCIVVNMQQNIYYNIFCTNFIGHARFIVMHLHVLLLTLIVLLSLHYILIVFSKFMFCCHYKFVLAFKNTICYSPPHCTCIMDNERGRGKVFLVSRIIS